MVVLCDGSRSMSPTVAGGREERAKMGRIGLHIA